jgi:hypothetical protein
MEKESEMAEQVRDQVQSEPPPFPVNTTVRKGHPYGVQSGSEPPSYLRIIIDLPPEAAEQYKQLVHQSGDSPTEFFRKAISLYKLSKEAVQEGKFVGIAVTEDSLETEFVGI